MRERLAARGFPGLGELLQTPGSMALVWAFAVRQQVRPAARSTTLTLGGMLRPPHSCMQGFKSKSEFLAMCGHLFRAWPSCPHVLSRASVLPTTDGRPGLCRGAIQRSARCPCSAWPASRPGGIARPLVLYERVKDCCGCFMLGVFPVRRPGNQYGLHL